MPVTVLVAMAVSFIIVHNLLGEEIEINPRQISTLARAKKQGVLADSGCVIHMANKNFISVRESCPEVARLIQQAKE
jgi:hypothetical protein